MSYSRFKIHSHAVTAQQDTEGSLNEKYNS